MAGAGPAARKSGEEPTHRGGARVENQRQARFEVGDGGLRSAPGVAARLLRGLAGTPERRGNVDAAAQGLRAAGLYWCGGLGFVAAFGLGCGCWGSPGANYRPAVILGLRAVGRGRDLRRGDRLCWRAREGRGAGKGMTGGPGGSAGATRARAG